MPVSPRRVDRPTLIKQTPLLSSPNRVKTWRSWKGCGPGELGEAHEDVLIVAGDISSSLERAAETLTDLKERYDEVRVVVGGVGGRARGGSGGCVIFPTGAG